MLAFSITTATTDADTLDGCHLAAGAAHVQNPLSPRPSTLPRLQCETPKTLLWLHHAHFEATSCRLVQGFALGFFVRVLGNAGALIP